MKVRTRLFNIECFKVIRDVLSICLQNNDKVVLIGQDNDCESLIDRLNDQPIDVILINLDNENLSETDSMCGTDICLKINELFPAMKILVHSIFDTANNIAKLMNAGATGFINKTMGFDELLFAIDTVQSGSKFLDIKSWRNYKNAAEFLAGTTKTLVPSESIFTKRELEILLLLSKGFSTKDISSTLFISLKTVETHRKNLVDKAGANNTAGLISFAHKHGHI
jgi:DNA-binding NarL/FixJ family response regulator